MQKINFNVEETNLMCCFDLSSRRRLIFEMKSLPLNELDDEMAGLVYKTVQKLEKLTDAEFKELSIMPDGLVED